MKLDHPGRFAMLPRTLLEIPARRPVDVSSGGGTIWLTLDDDPRDVVLERGEQVRIESNRRVLAYALDSAVLEVREVRERVPASTTPVRQRFAFA
jgi:hypothetical protein